MNTKIFSLVTVLLAWTALVGCSNVTTENNEITNEVWPELQEEISDEGTIDDVEVKLDWNWTSEKFSHEELQAAVDKIANYFNVEVEFQQIFYQWDEESANKLDYCKEVNSEIDDCVFFKTNIFVPEQEAELAWAFEPNKTVTDYEFYLWRTGSGDWTVVTAWY